MSHAARQTICALAGVALALTLVSCTQQKSTRTTNATNATAANPASNEEPPAVALGEITPGIHNLFAVAPGVFSGSGPEDAEAFDSLRSLGVKTIISVDGARPNLDLAHQRGMTYVHIPIGYDGMAPEQEVALAKALRDMPGPVYIHCHHGKHRGPTGAAVALVGLGRMSNAQAEAFMHEAGTSVSYPGLWACAARAEPHADAELDEVGALPEVQIVSGLVDSMVAIDQTWERIKLIRKAGWATPAGHPDLVPAAEAGMLADHFRVMTDDPETTLEGEAFVKAMQLAASRAAMLETALATSSPDAAAAERAYQAVGESCSVCHKGWRN